MRGSGVSGRGFLAHDVAGGETPALPGVFRILTLTILSPPVSSFFTIRR